MAGLICAASHRGIGQHSMKKHRSGGDLLATLSVYDLTDLEVEPLPLTPKAMSLSLYQPAGY